MDYDLVIVGSGIVGAANFYINRQKGMKIAIIDENITGGDVSRFGGAVHLTFGKNESFDYSSVTEHYLEEFCKLPSSPIERKFCKIKTENAELFPNSHFCSQNNCFLQNCYIINPAELSRHIITNFGDSNLDIYECSKVKKVLTQQSSILLMDGRSISYKKLILAIGNDLSVILPRIEYEKKFKRLVTITLKTNRKDKKYMRYDSTTDTYIFPHNNFIDILCFPTEMYSKNSKFFPNWITKDDLLMANGCLKHTFKDFEWKILGGRVSKELYTANRLPIITNDIYKNIGICFGFSGSGLRYSFGAAKKLSTLMEI